ncbi:V-type ATP synthase subunit A, partial [Candidatus Bathyarchaeota archaeon]|nr:V-type ATP synthase subunit A [Candidatus Bathyarchaeota archaeon]
PAYLADRIASLYERSGRVQVPATEERIGSLTLLGAVSPPGGDYSEPVTTTTLRFIGTFWALDSQLAYRRHFPAINWLQSFSRYLGVAAAWWGELDPTWEPTRGQALRILEEAAEVEETARIIGEKSLPDDQRLILLVAEMLREGFLVQSAFHDIDRYCAPEKQVKLLKLFTDFYNTVRPLIETGIPIDQVRELDVIREIMRLKEREGTDPIDAAHTQMMNEIDALAKHYEGENA